MELNVTLVFWTVFFNLVVLEIKCEDFYSILGVDKGASVKEIRKAFKKIAISRHPDKNTNDPDAHNVFIKINRAYEVLKDEDLRKKYDQYGEEGLKDDFLRGRQYESWQFYQQNFGIYDDDPEIITLSRADFEQSVEGTDEPWFINFYSPHCSHCHEMAPSWRELARELEGVIRIGAVNCEDDWQLCRMQGIRSYPTLVFYPQKEKYYGERSVERMIDEAMHNVKTGYHDIWTGNYKEVIYGGENDLPWLITFCGDGGDCLESRSCLKLAAMLADLVKVGRVDCHTDKKLCHKLGKEYGTFFYGTMVAKNQGLEITSLYVKDIATAVLHELPDVQIIEEEKLMKIERNTQNHNWLVHFVNSKDNHDIELRKLPALLKGYNVGRVDCSSMRESCARLHIIKYPTFILFKRKAGREVYYGGRMTAHDIAAFVHDSIDAPLENLSPDDFPDRVVLSRDPWLVDFFAPWCPPCMRLLPEFKKASKSHGTDAKFGTVDCTVHRNLCDMYNIHSYPTTIFYNESIPHQYHGHHTAGHLVEFIHDTMHPPAIGLTQATFTSMVMGKDDGDIWLIDFFAPWCGPCQQLAPEWRKLAKMLKGQANVHVGLVDCQAHQSLCQTQNIHSYPTMRLYPIGPFNSQRFHHYNGWHRDASSLRAWVFEYLPSKAVALTHDVFAQKVLQNPTAWIVDFYAPWCGHCQVFKPEFEKVAEGLQGYAFAGKVDCDQEHQLCREAGVRAYPTVRFYKGALDGKRQNAYGWDVQSQDAEHIITFVKQNRNKKVNRKTTKDEL